MTYAYPTIEEMLYRYVFPVVKFREISEGRYQPIAAVGTGFTFGEGTFVTCWHCVSDDLGTDEFYGVPYGDDMSRPNKVAILSNTRRTPSGADLATATIARSLGWFQCGQADHPSWTRTPSRLWESLRES